MTRRRNPRGNEAARRAERDRDHERSRREALRRGLVTPPFQAMLEPRELGTRYYTHRRLMSGREVPRFKWLVFPTGWGLSIQPAAMHSGWWEVMWIRPPIARGQMVWEYPPGWEPQPVGPHSGIGDIYSGIGPADAVTDQQVQELLELLVREHGMPTAWDPGPRGDGSP